MERYDVYILDHPPATFISGRMVQGGFLIRIGIVARLFSRDRGIAWLVYDDRCRLTLAWTRMPATRYDGTKVFRALVQTKAFHLPFRIYFQPLTLRSLIPLFFSFLSSRRRESRNSRKSPFHRFLLRKVFFSIFTLSFPMGIQLPLKLEWHSYRIVGWQDEIDRKDHDDIDDEHNVTSGRSMPEVSFV